MLKIKIYDDEFLTGIPYERTVQRMKIPYRTADAVLDILADLDLDNVDEMQVFKLALRNKQHITAVVRATFGLTEDELARVDVMDLYGLAREIVQYVMGQIATLGEGEADPNAPAQA